jgi:pimeloyl-ACP methyl ester carboxylesterase
MPMKKLLLILNCFIVSSFAAENNLTTIESGISFYTEYYPNTTSKFRGTIIFENGSGTTTDEWTQNKTFFNCARQVGSIFIYDRNGLGKSPADLNTSVNNPITAELVTGKLMEILKKRHIPEPYIIVGHSYGGLYADYFARKYSSNISGVFLIDPAPESFQYSDSLMSKLDIESWNKIPNSQLYKDYSYENANKYHLMTSAEVFYQLKGLNQSQLQLNRLPKLSDKIPIIIVSSTQMESANVIKGAWFEKQKAYLNSNSKSKIIQIESGHFIQLEQPQVVCDQLKQILN